MAKTDKIDKDTLHDLYIVQEWSAARIATKFDMCPSTVKTLLEKNGIKLRTKTQACRINRARFIYRDVRSDKFDRQIEIK